MMTMDVSAMVKKEGGLMSEVKILSGQNLVCSQINISFVPR